MKRLFLVAVAVVALVASGCRSGGCGSCSSKGHSSPWLHCDPPCYGKSLQRNTRQVMDFVDVYLLNYDRHDPYRCDPCLGN
jgi:hypothetical protein